MSSAVIQIGLATPSLAKISLGRQRNWLAARISDSSSKTPSAFHHRAQRTAFRRRDVHRRPILFAPR